MQITSNNKTITSKSYTSDIAKGILEDILAVNSDPQVVFDKLAEEVVPKLLHGTDEEKLWAKNEISCRSEEAVMALGLTNHYHLIPTTDKQYAALILSMTQQIEKDYDCKTAVEKALAEQIAIGHIKVIDYSRRFEEWCGNGHLSKDAMVRFLGVLSRHIDRTSRQLLTAITVLQQIKRPPLEVNINTKNAFVAHNQQINDNSNIHEIV
jgi:hypothetical protein